MMYLLILTEFPLQLIRHSCKKAALESCCTIIFSSAQRERLSSWHIISWVQRGHTGKNLCIWMSTSVRSRPRSTLVYLNLPDFTPYVYTVCSCSSSPHPPTHPAALRNGLTPPRHQCQSDEWVSNSVWSSHQRHADLNAQPWEKAGRRKTS